jgi:putative transposase
MVIPLPKTKGMRKPNFFGKISEEILMKMTRYSEPQILAILRQAEGGVPVSELCREHGMSNASFYKWRSKYGGMPSRQIAMQSPAE